MTVTSKLKTAAKAVKTTAKKVVKKVDEAVVEPAAKLLPGGEKRSRKTTKPASARTKQTKK